MENGSYRQDDQGRLFRRDGSGGWIRLVPHDEEYDTAARALHGPVDDAPPAGEPIVDDPLGYGSVWAPGPDPRRRAARAVDACRSRGRSRWNSMVTATAAARVMRAGTVGGVGR
jgi:hypothetical protein